MFIAMDKLMRTLAEPPPSSFTYKQVDKSDTNKWISFEVASCMLGKFVCLDNQKSFKQ